MTTTTYKYYIGEQGFKNKRDYNNALAIRCLSDSGENKLSSLMGPAISRIQDKMGLEEDKAMKAVHIGFRNSQQKKLNQTLEKTVENLTTKGYVELVLFSYTAGGGVVANGRTVLYRKDFNEHGLHIIGDLVVDPVEKTAPIEVKADKNTEMKLSISEDFDITD